MADEKYCGLVLEQREEGNFSITFLTGSDAGRQLYTRSVEETSGRTFAYYNDFEEGQETPSGLLGKLGIDLTKFHENFSPQEDTKQ